MRDTRFRTPLLLVTVLYILIRLLVPDSILLGSIVRLALLGILGLYAVIAGWKNKRQFDLLLGFALIVLAFTDFVFV